MPPTAAAHSSADSKPALCKRGATTRLSDSALPRRRPGRTSPGCRRRNGIGEVRAPLAQPLDSALPGSCSAAHPLSDRGVHLSDIEACPASIVTSSRLVRMSSMQWHAWQQHLLHAELASMTCRDPPLQCRVIYAGTAVEVDWWADRILRDPQIGVTALDIEWRVTFKTGESRCCFQSLLQYERSWHLRRNIPQNVWSR